MKWGRTTARRPCRGLSIGFAHWIIAVVSVMLLGPALVESQLVPCNTEAETPSIAKALLNIEQSVDPCGDSAEVIAVLQELKRCKKTSYRICSDPKIDRNTFDRPVDADEQTLPRTISWNPDLRSQLELGCDGDPSKPVLRDPTASLLHELAHAAQDCEGLNPGEHELEAVRTENIYRRAAGLCQRQRYGDDPLPAEMVKICAAGRCPCSHPNDPGDQRARKQLASPESGAVTSSGDARLQKTGK